MTNNQKDKFSIKQFFDFREVIQYFFRRKEAIRKPDFNLRIMHGINRLSIIIFLAAIIFLIIRNFIWK